MGGYTPHTSEDRAQMLAAIGVSDVESLFKDIPQGMRAHEISQIPSGISELEVAEILSNLSKKNRSASDRPNFLGAGTYHHFIPSTVGTLVSRSEFATSYTPYQPEVAQGNLQAMYEYQSMICALTELPVSNASLYDGATALAEAASIAVRTTGSRRILLARTLSPFSREVLQAYANGAGWAMEEVPFDIQTGQTDLFILKEKLKEGAACFIFQQPNFFGVIEAANEIGDILSHHTSLLISSVDPISLGMLTPPGKYDADIAVGNGQALGNTLNFGGPTFGFFACKKERLRLVPGRIAGRTKDGDGKDGFVLTLQTREQHIRREKATSNICTNEALNALAGSIYLALVGPEGLRQVALLSMERARMLKESISKIDGVTPYFRSAHFKEFLVRLPHSPTEINARLGKMGIIGGYDVTRYYPELSGGWLLCATEMTKETDIQALGENLARILKDRANA